MILTIDYLQFSAELQKPILAQAQIIKFDNFELRPKPYGSQHFHNHFEVYIHGYGNEELSKNPLKIGDILSRPRALLTQVTIMVQFENWLLYSDRLKGMYYDLRRALSFELKTISRLDIALDMSEAHMNADKFQEFCTYLSSGEINNVQKTNNVQFHTQLFNGARRFTGLVFGSRKSDKYARMYNKTLEMNDMSFKPWILAFWNKNFIHVTSDVYRLEVVLKRRYFAKFEATHIWILDQLFNYESLKYWFVASMNNYFDFKWMGGNENYELIKWSEIESEIEPLDMEASPTVKDTTRSTVIACKRILKSYYLNPEPQLIKAIKSLLSSNSFAESHFNRKFPDYIEDIESQTGIKKEITIEFWRIYSTL